MESVVVKNVKTNEIKEVQTDGVFMFVGYDPVSDLVKGLVDMDEKGLHHHRREHEHQR